MQNYDLKYAARIDKDDDGYNVSFIDFDNIFTCGDTWQEAVENAQEALELMLEHFLETGEHIPESTSADDSCVMIPVGIDVAAPILLKRFREQAGKTQKDVANAMGVQYQQYQRLEKPGTNITLKTLRKATSAVGGIASITFLKQSNT